MAASLIMQHKHMVNLVFRVLCVPLLCVFVADVCLSWRSAVRDFLHFCSVLPRTGYVQALDDGVLFASVMSAQTTSADSDPLAEFEQCTSFGRTTRRHKQPEKQQERRSVALVTRLR